MLPLSQPTPQNQGASRGMTIAQLILSGLGLVVSLLAAAGALAFGLMELFGTPPALKETTPTFALAWIFLFGVLIAIPSLTFSIFHLLGKEAPRPHFKISSFQLASMALVIWALVLVLGNAVSANEQVAWLLLPPLQLLAIGLPIWWLFEMARRGLSIGNQQRGWGVFNFGVFITTPLLMVLEIVVMVALVLGYAIWVSQNEAVLRSLQLLSEQISRLRGNPQAILPLVMPYLQNPVVIYAILAVIAGLMPMLEELFKPLALWVFAGLPLTPAQGFVGGALSGAAFAIIESLFYLSMPVGENWAALVIGRSGTCLLHITTTALVGRAMANAWGKGAYLQLGGTYLLAVALHGLWNALSIISGLAATFNPVPADLRVFVSISQVTPYAIAALVVLLFGLLWLSRRQLARENRPSDVDANHLSQFS